MESIQLEIITLIAGEDMIKRGMAYEVLRYGFEEIW